MNSTVETVAASATADDALAEAADEILMKRYAAGEAAAFDALYARHRDPLYRYLLRGCQSRALAAELFQDVWLRLIHARDRYRPSRRFTVWLYALAHHRLVDCYRRTRPGGELPEQAAPDREQPEAEARRDENARRVHAAIARLPFEQREAILLREERELGLDDIAAVTGVGRETVKSRLRYALAKLRRELNDEPA